MKAVVFLICLTAILAADSLASVAVVMQRKTGTANTNTGQDHALQAVQLALESFGQPYNLFKAGATKTDSVRFGSFEIRPGVWQRFTVVIHAGFAIATQTAGYIPDGLATVPGAPTSHAVHVMVGNGGVAAALTQTTACSTGTPVSVAGSTTRDLAYVAYKTGSPWVFKPLSQKLGVASATRAAPGIWRPLIGYAATASTAASVPSNPDSKTQSNDPDTLAMWARDFSPIRVAVGASNFEGGKVLFVHWQGSLTRGDSRLIASALAWADSNSSGGVFSSRDKLPQKFAIHIDDGFKRGDATGPGGIKNTDSSTAIASMDSLGTLNAPIVVGVGADSVNSYPNERAWWPRIKSVKYAPHTHGGAEVNNTGGDNASYQRPLDVFGLLRTRFAVGDGTGAGRDTSIASLLKGSFAVCGQWFGSNNVDRVIMAPGENWAPSVAHQGVPIGPDSLFYAFSQGGAVGVRSFVNGPPKTTSSALGSVGTYYNDNVLASNSISSAKVAILPCTDYSGSGGDYNGSGTTVAAEYTGSIPTVSLVPTTLYNGLLLGFHEQVFGRDLDNSGPVTANFWSRPRILVVHASDLCGERPGYFVIKHAVHSARIINAFTNDKRLVDVAWPEQLIE